MTLTRCALTACLSVFLAAAATAAPSTANPQAPSVPPLAYPESRTVDQVDTLHGQEVADPYRWLEEDVRVSDEVAAWVKAQQQLTERYLDDLPELDAIKERLTSLWNFERYGAPRKVGERYLYSKNDGLQNQAVLYIADSYKADGRVLIDPNTWSADGTVALAATSASEDGRYLAYQKSEAGSDWRKIYVMDLDSRQTLEDELQWVKFTSVTWDKEGRGFYYKRYPEPAEGEQFQSVALNPTIYYHKIGAPQSDDRVVFRLPEHPDWSLGVGRTYDGKHLLATARRGTDWQNQLYTRPADQPDAEFRVLVDNFDALFSPIGSDGDTLYLLTDYQAPRRRVVAMDLNDPSLDKLREIIPESKAALEDVSHVGGKLIANYLHDVASEVKVFSTEGKLERTVELPGLGSAGGFGGKPDQDETFYTFSSYDHPPSTYRYDIATGESQLVRQPNVDFDPADYQVSRVFYNSKDGTRIPMFLAHKKGIELNGQNPTLLYAYGGFSISVTPGFSISRLAWMERGGVLAVANLRGGGEYGEDWHQAGKLEKKQNVFDDFIAAAEWLIDNKYASPATLGIQGRSNGGLLVGAVMTQRPELFGACLPGVGVMDMLRFHRFTAGQFWRSEYGSADEPDQFETLLAYSPYHNIEPGVSYPPTLISTADTDDRVVPMHSFKFGARLQAAQGGDAPILMHIESRAGHGAGTPTTKLIEQAADDIAFLLKHLGD
ncbi:Prolyl endopeptidase precursor [Posidoniimonas polymericola]|uniref:prolyl oligopeptidase n=1 Tax=Posidoniimonas polymericola TaxID=2528002 RepID=A0A5C5YTA7_9BACT|nr:prolyl oligopeptidase family serine peptidase [Posidoniimonas polymericola]TWT78188.1 Prolyl endopeptidase precursor [Posidoniimonas polymericola]